MKIILVMFALGLLAGPAFAVDYTITVTAAQDAALQQSLDEVNAANETSVSKAEYAQDIFTNIMTDFLVRFEILDVASACENYKNLNESGKDSVASFLGGLSPCKATR